MKIKVYLDMDGTIADLYGIENWLPRLRNEDPEIFLECKPMITEEKLFQIFPENEYLIKILTMTPKDCTNEYHENVKEQKAKWLQKYFPKLSSQIYMRYGFNKNLKNSASAILVDDSEPIRESWKGTALNPAELWG